MHHSDSESESTQPPARRLKISAGYLVALGLIYGATASAWLFLGSVTERRTLRSDSDLRHRVGRIWGEAHRQRSPRLTLRAMSASATARPARAGQVTPTAYGASRPSKWAPRGKAAAKIKAKAMASSGAKAKAKASAKRRAKARAKAKRRAKGKAKRSGDAAKTAAAAAPAKKPKLLPVACRATRTLEARSTRARAGLELTHRRKGLLWYATYRVRFDGVYAFANPTPCARVAQLDIDLPAKGAAYDNFRVTVDGREAPFSIVAGVTARVSLTLPPASRRRVRVTYASRGLDRWAYAFGARAARARDFQLLVRTNFAAIDFPDGTLAPTRKQRDGDGWQLTWRFGNLLSDSSIAVAMPKKLNPGPLASEISRFAPISLLFFFGILLLVSVLRDVPLHPVHYGMLAAAFFSFHLLLAYLVDQVSLPVAFGIAAATSVLLVVSYLRLAVGGRFALVWAGGAQLCYLVLFSLAFFFEGYTGLTITLFSVATLFVVMQLTGRIDWAELLRGRSGAAPSPSPSSSPSASPSLALPVSPTPAPTGPLPSTPAPAPAGSFHDVG